MFRTTARIGRAAVVVALRFTVVARDWQTLDIFPAGDASGAEARGVALDAVGGVYVVGCQTATSGQSLWLVRKGAASMPQPALRLAAAGKFLSVSWPISAIHWTFDWADSPLASANWTPYGGAASLQNGLSTVSLSPTNKAVFFR
jgi:hypothetical protein